MRYAVVIEKAENNYSAYVPDLPGCGATGATVEKIGEKIGKNRKNKNNRDRHYYRDDSWCLRS